ncbi:MAG: hypothetical protein KAT65_21535 [Methanophagales archaeon]|nr:hypothetical protein [Methanophagales archaeon]
MNKWFRWVVYAPEISKLEDIIQTAVRELEKQKENDRIEKFYFLQYTQDVHVTFGIKLPEERSSEVFEEIKLQLQGALNRDFTEKERLNKDEEEPYPYVQELKAIATECALLSKDGVPLIASLACFSHFLLNASSALGAIRIIDNKLRIDKNWLDNESDNLIKLKGDNKKLFDKIEGYLGEMIGVNIEFIEITKNTEGKGERR